MTDTQYQYANWWCDMVIAMLKKDTVALAAGLSK